MKSRKYSELKKLKTFEERYNYLKLNGTVGESTFGHERYLNQEFYKRDPRWLEARSIVIIRDNGCDLGVEGRAINDSITIHHMNPVTIEEIENDSPNLYNPEYLISTSRRTHQAIHYGDKTLLPKEPVVRTKDDTKLW